MKPHLPITLEMEANGLDPEEVKMFGALSVAEHQSWTRHKKNNPFFEQVARICCQRMKILFQSKKQIRGNRNAEKGKRISNMFFKVFLTRKSCMDLRQ